MFAREGFSPSDLAEEIRAQVPDAVTYSAYERGAAEFLDAGAA